jgi:hypothetical protein
LGSGIEFGMFTAMLEGRWYKKVFGGENADRDAANRVDRGLFSGFFPPTPCRCPTAYLIGARRGVRGPPMARRVSNLLKRVSRFDHDHHLRNLGRRCAKWQFSCRISSYSTPWPRWSPSKKFATRVCSRNPRELPCLVGVERSPRRATTNNLISQRGCHRRPGAKQLQLPPSPHLHPRERPPVSAAVCRHLLPPSDQDQARRRKGCRGLVGGDRHWR